MKFFLSLAVPAGRLVSCLLLLAFLWWHWQLGLTRYFDVDEFAHLSWAYQMLSGRIPYIDFLFFFPPGFHLFLMPIFALGGGVTPILAGRLVQFTIFAVLVGVTMLLFWLMRRSWVAILAGVFLAFLPLPFDKFLEIRPDTLAVLFAMVGMVLQILASQGRTLRPRKVRPYVFAGFFYGISLLILPKTLPQVGVAMAVALCTKNIRSLLVGIAIPLAVFGLWALTLGNLDRTIYSLMKLPVEANKISQTFIMMPDLFFYPNTTFYGAPGWSTGLLVNHAIWIIAIFMGAYRLVAPLLAQKSEIRNPKSETISNVQNAKKSKQFRILNFLRFEFVSNFVLRASNLDNRSMVWSEFQIAATFFVYVIFYVQIVPLKHTQYLIPIAVFIAFYAADAIDMIWRHAKVIVIIGFPFLAIGLYQTFFLVNTPKLAWTNADTIGRLTRIYETISTSEYILDLTGETIYYKHPYVVCCLPFGQSAPYLSRPLPALALALEKTKTKYIFEGGLTRTNTLLPDDQAYIAAHYLPHPAIAGLLVRK